MLPVLSKTSTPWLKVREKVRSQLANFAITLTPIEEADFYWIGQVPCRTVHIVGLIVGVKVYEKRIRYTRVSVDIILSYPILIFFS